MSVKWAKSVPAFLSLPFRDQVVLLEVAGSRGDVRTQVAAGAIHETGARGGQVVHGVVHYVVERGILVHEQLRVC